ncbi:MAG: hypothetical protein M1834_000988 [Cirrosporium novae-zelandiae]|nr:MAG: hypothetical protein M1834_000988 [Cirrosporium novae-zelandiae]
MKKPLIFCGWLTLLFAGTVNSLRYDAQYKEYNLNQNKTATDPVDYWGEWADHDYTPSPKNWRMPFYTLFLDRYVNGDPANDDANGTQFEHDILANQLRHGGDVRGLIDSLDYLQGFGIKGIYLAGSPMINQPWASDGYSPLDLTLLDEHFGNINDWRDAITAIHDRGIMGDLIGFKGYLNASTPFSPKEHDYVWKTSRRYLDFEPSNKWLDSCEYPRFWQDDGYRQNNLTNYLVGCRESEFDQYGEIAAFGDYGEWQRQISKFAFVQDRLREWRTDVRLKLERFSCIAIAMLDFDGYRIDKALQVTVDAQGEWSDAIRTCARKLGKDNFFIPGEMVASNSFASIYVGRGKQPNHKVTNITKAILMTNESKNLDQYVIRDEGKQALDAAAFHYSVYRAMTRFLGMDGIYAAEYDTSVNWVDGWNDLLSTNDMINANTGVIDPRHMIGVTNQDVFRWPGIKNGTHKQMLGLYVVSLLIPGIPTLSWGEEQNFYVLDSQAANYVYGRSPFSSAQAWQIHGCYKMGSSKYKNFPIEKSLYGCLDDNISLDHRDSTHPLRNILKHMFELRDNYPVIQDGLYLQQLSNKTYQVFLPGSNGTETETGMWSVLRARWEGIQDFTGTGQGNQSVWLVYQNDNKTVNYTFDCSNETDALISPFAKGTTVKNLFYPYDEYTLEASTVKLGLDGSSDYNGCLSSLELRHWGYKAFVPKKKFVSPSPVLTGFSPGHDFRKLSTVDTGESFEIEIEFSDEMSCDDITNNISINSTTEVGVNATLDTSTVTCGSITANDSQTYNAERPSLYYYRANLTEVYQGIHKLTINNVSTSDGDSYTNSVDHFIIRIGTIDNPMVFPKSANYSWSLLNKESNGSYTVTHSAPGADLWRYSLNFGTTYSDWMHYSGGNDTLAPRNWTGTSAQAWEGQHVIVQYWSRISGSSDHYQHGDYFVDGQKRYSRQFPNLWVEGDFNEFGYDAGLANQLTLSDNNTWKIDFMTEWPANISLNAWGVNPDGKPDSTRQYGDVDNDGILDRLPAQSLVDNVIEVKRPSGSHLGFRIIVSDHSFSYTMTGIGSKANQIILAIFLALIPITTASLCVWLFMKSFYQVKFNEFGTSEKTSIIKDFMGKHGISEGFLPLKERFAKSAADLVPLSPKPRQPVAPPPMGTPNALAQDAGAPNRRTVLIATMEYDISDWGIKVKIGGLGVMAQLMGANLSHQDLIWVIPSVGGIDYPIDERADPMEVVVLGTSYNISVQYHKLRNITYVILDAPIFRQQSKAEPYPPRMDDLDSAVYYSAWNQCIAQTINRFPEVDLYHINDYHGAVAPLYLLPRTIPCALSLHNAEFQGLWPMRTATERMEVCQIFNLDPDIVKKYVQFGDVFNLLHAGASYLRVHQQGFGAVGVSKKYGKRSWARYPIFWGLKEIGALPNPDPSDTAEWNKEEYLHNQADVHIDPAFEAGRGDLRRQAQEWANLTVNPKADLFVFVGRWSMQKGVDLIADVFPQVLEEYPETQLICVGPVIDLYGRFAAIKLDKMMEVYPGRVFSKPEFTALPPYIFSGAEFALIPSRDEPFGLVAVEFGRKGALGVGARVGGLGQMPGWWYTIESTTTKHMLRQFKEAIHDSLKSKTEDRAMMRARSAKQRFPVAQWVEDLMILQDTAIKEHNKHSRPASKAFGTSFINSIRSSAVNTPTGTRPSSPVRGREEIRPPTAITDDVRSSSRGPGHMPRGRKKLQRRSGHSGVTNSFLSVDSARTPNNEEEDEDEDEEDDGLTMGGTSGGSGYKTVPTTTGSPNLSAPGTPFGGFSSPQNSGPLTPNYGAQADYLDTPPLGGFEDTLLPPSAPALRRRTASTSSILSLDSVVGDKKDYKLQQVDPFFTDQNKEYAKVFKIKLTDLNAKNSEDALCIEEFLAKSEKDWYNRYRDLKLGKSPATSPAPSVLRMKRHSEHRPSFAASDDSDSPVDAERGPMAQFQLSESYVPPTGLKKFLQRKLGDWPYYSILLSFGQIIAANSYQITLLSGEIGEAASKLYVIATIYAIFSVIWWWVYRRFSSVYVLSAPFIFYGIGFFFIGMAPFASSSGSRGTIQNFGSGFYAAASSSGSFFFALNFGDEGGSAVTKWVFRSCIVQGTQQLYIAMLWWWGSDLTKASENGVTATLVETHPVAMTLIGVLVAFLMWGSGALVYLGLPTYYRQAPGKVPSFYMSLLRRKVIDWFFLMVIIQNFWLSAPYGRNWLYLWSSAHTSAWQIVILILVFFVGVWAAMLWILSFLSTSHSWIIPIFAIGLGAPRWAQMLWGVSGVGEYVPWASSLTTGAILGRMLWCWLGVLDSLQGVGFGMILLHTLTRFHISFVLIAAQVLGSIATILARAIAPDNLGPGTVFPNFGLGWYPGLSYPWFWIALLCQLSICFLCFAFFRKEQLSKP